MTKKISATDALEQCFQLTSLRNGPHGNPGEVVNLVCRNNPLAREALQNLRSEDIQNIRVDTFLAPPVKKR